MPSCPALRELKNLACPAITLFQVTTDAALLDEKNAYF
jgi:hypothetical protein